MAKKTTKKVRDDHKQWRCRQTLKQRATCYEYNSMDTKQCYQCKSRRDVGDKAVNQDGDTIGRLEKVDKDGAEWWLYLSEPEEDSFMI